MLLEIIKSEIARVLLFADLQFRQQNTEDELTALELTKLLLKLEKLARLTA